MIKMQRRITIIVPCYNEDAVIRIFYDEVKRCVDCITDCGFSYLFINDGSKDDTLARLKELASVDGDVSYISFSRNFGKEAAMMAGLDFAQGDAVIIMDADLQHPPALLPEMVHWWRQGYDDVCAKRTSRDDETWLKRTMADIFYSLMQRICPNEVKRDVGDFRLLDMRCVKALRLLREKQRFTKGLFTWVGFRKKEIPFAVQPRAAGKSNWSYFALFGLAIRGITSFTTAPLRLTTLLGLTVSGASIAYMTVVLVCALLYGDPVAGYPTLITVLLFLGGVQLLALGIIGEYVGQIFYEVKDRPVYLVEEMSKSLTDT